MRVRASVHKIAPDFVLEGHRKGRLYVRTTPNASQHTGEALQAITTSEASLDARISGVAGVVAELAMAADIDQERRDRIVGMAAGLVVRHEFAEHMPAQGQLPQERTQ